MLRSGVSTALRQQSMLMRAQALESEDLGKNIGSDQLWNLKPSNFSVLLYTGRDNSIVTRYSKKSGL